MGTAQLGSWSFDVDPESVEWEFSVKTAVERTIGGKVVQVLGVNIGDVQVAGSFGSGGRAAQDRFVEWFKQEARSQADVAAYEPLRFIFPYRNWDMQVYLKSLVEPGGSRSVNMTVGNFNPSFVMTLHITEDHSQVSLARETQLGFIERISREFGWERTEYNGPMTIAEVQESLRNDGTSIDEVLGLIDLDALSGEPPNQTTTSFGEPPNQTTTNFGEPPNQTRTPQ